VVEYAGWKGGFGRFVSIRHNSTFTSTYGHLAGFGKGVRRGSRVAQGHVIGYVGSSGLSTGPHLDFFQRAAGTSIPRLTRLGIGAEGEMAAFDKPETFSSGHELHGLLSDRTSSSSRRSSSRHSVHPRRQ
jgi:hypothetical protein